MIWKIIAQWMISAQRPEPPCFLLKKHSEVIYYLFWVTDSTSKTMLCLSYFYILFINWFVMLFEQGTKFVCNFKNKAANILNLSSKNRDKTKTNNEVKLCFLSKAKMWYTVYLSSILQSSIVTVSTCTEWRGPLNHPHVHRSISKALVHLSHCCNAYQSSHVCLCTLPTFANSLQQSEKKIFFYFLF